MAMYHADWARVMHKVVLREVSRRLADPVAAGSWVLGGVALFVRMLGSCWASQARDTSHVTDVEESELRAWLRGIRAAPAHVAGEIVVAATEERTIAAARYLISEAKAGLAGITPVDWSEIASRGQALRRIVHRGHGTKFPGGEFADAHSRMLIGLGNHLTNPFSSRLSYQEAAREYLGHGDFVLSSLAQLGASTSARLALLGGERDEIHARFAALAGAAPELGALLRPYLDDYLRTLDFIAALVADAAGTPPASGAEAASLVEVAAQATLDNVACAIRLARAADDLAAEAGEQGKALTRVGQTLARYRRWADAAPVLEECHASNPEDRDIAQALADSWLELDRWDEAKALLISMLSDPPGPEDALALQTLQGAAFNRQDPEYQHWQDLLADIDPSRTLTGQAPMPPGGRPEPLRARFTNGNLEVAANLLELAPKDAAAHMTAAVIAGSSDGAEQLSRLEESDPEMARKVMRLLGVRKLSPTQAQARQHFDAAEHLFGRNRFAEAAVEYEKALELDPDDAEALLYLGDTWFRRGAYELAQAYFEESLVVAPSPQAFRFLGDAIGYGGGSLGRARNCYQEALRLDPSYGGAKTALAHLDSLEREAHPDASGDDSGSRHAAARALRWSDDLREIFPAAELWAPQQPQAPVSQPEQVPPAVASGPALSRSDSAGDRLLEGIVRTEPHGAVAAGDDDEAFARWLAAASPGSIAAAIMAISSLAFQYEAKDRDLARWGHWVQRQVQLAEALPADFGYQTQDDLGRNRLLADAYAERASVLYSESRLAEARTWLERAADLMVAERDERDRRGLGGEPQFDRLFRTEDPQGSILDRLAGICHELGDAAAARRYLDQSREAAQGRPTTESLIHTAIANGDQAADPDTALGAYHWALEQAEEDAVNQVVPRALAHSLNAIGRGHYRLRLYRSALKYFEGARRVNELTGNAQRLSYDFLEIGRVYRVRPELGDARAALEQSLVYASVPAAETDEFAWQASDGRPFRVTAPDRAWTTLLELGSLLEERSTLADASAVLRLATELAEVARAAAPDDAERVAIANQRIEAFEALTRLHLRQAIAGGDLADAFTAAAWTANEAMRARSFLDAIGDDDVALPAAVPRELADQETVELARRQQLLRAGTRAAGFWDELRHAQARLDAVWDRMLAVAPASAEYVEVRRARPAPPGEIQAMIACDGEPTAIVSLMPLGPDWLAAIALRSDTSRPLVASEHCDLARLARFVNGNLGTAGRVRELATDLEDLFLHEMQPVSRVLAQVSDPGDTLVVCPFGTLNYVPIGALQASGTCLAERNTLAILPSASLSRVLRMTQAAGGQVPAMVFGDPTGDLRGARDEAAAVATIFDTSAKLGSAATRAAVTDALTRAGIVHVAAHAHFDVTEPLSSGLRLSDGVLEAQAILTMSAPALSLVTLSACETGVSEVNPAQELLGLTRSLLFAGADSLLVSLWKVPDAPTVDIMSDFYGELSRGRGKARALQTAMLHARDKHGTRFDRWAGFELIGEWR